MTENEQRPPKLEIIALPPLRMVLVHTKEEHLSRAALAAMIKKIALQSVTAKEQVKPQAIKKIIQHLEKRS
jgi:hypothetical protein